mmetsp:Transcript_6608/g.16983  ORF Transcript_6608/g.16983 Transcript_6608/m.16983 type:complete len:100 (+) Transcript_6608:120-419(+)
MTIATTARRISCQRCKSDGKRELKIRKKSQAVLLLDVVQQRNRMGEKRRSETNSTLEWSRVTGAKKKNHKAWRGFVSRGESRQATIQRRRRHEEPNHHH